MAEEEKISSELKALAAAYSQLNAQSNRLWTAAALLFITVVATRFNAEGEATVYGVAVSIEWFFLATLIISVFLNFAYCSSHIVNLQAASMYFCYVREKGLHKEYFVQSPQGKRYSYESFAHILYNSNNNRVFPIEQALGIKSLLYKTAVDLIYSSVPLVTSLAAFYRLAQFKMGIGLLLCLGGVVFSFSIVPWLALVGQLVNWSKLRSK